MQCKQKCCFLFFLPRLELFSWLLKSPLVVLEVFLAWMFWMMVARLEARFQHSSLMDSWLLRLTARPYEPSNYLKKEEPCWCKAWKDSCVKLDPAFKDATLAFAGCFYSLELEQEILTSAAFLCSFLCFCMRVHMPVNVSVYTYATERVLNMSGFVKHHSTSR